MSYILSCQLAGGRMIDGIIIEIVTLSGMVDCIEERRQDRRRRLCDARLPIGLASDAPYRNAQTKMRRVAPAHCLADKSDNDVKQLFDRNGRALRGQGYWHGLPPLLQPLTRPSWFDARLTGRRTARLSVMVRRRLGKRFRKTALTTPKSDCRGNRKLGKTQKLVAMNGKVRAFERSQFVTLTRASWTANLRLAQGLVMSDTPIRREPPPKLDRDPAAHERRARLIAQLHEQAIATANDLSARHKAIRADFAKDARRRKAAARFFSAGAFLLALGCIVAVSCILAG